MVGSLIIGVATITSDIIKCCYVGTDTILDVMLNAGGLLEEFANMLIALM